MVQSNDTLQIAKNLSDQIYDIIINRIVTGVYQKGDKISINKLADEFGVSRSPVKDAFNKLYGTGVIDISPRKGHYVKSLSLAEVEKIFEFRFFLELSVYSKIIGKLDEGKYDELKAMIDESLDIVGRKREEDIKRLFLLNRNFHLELFKLADNDYMLESYEKIYLLSHTYKAYFSESAQEDHIALLEAIYHGREGRMKEALQTHIERARQEYIRLEG
jgi:DNA-binding GntR family transcriptional regulator